MIRCYASRWIVSTLVTVSCLARPGKNPFPQIGEIRLNDWLVAKGQAPIKNISVFALSFSPDGSRLAIQFGDDIDRDVVRLGQAKREYLLVLSTADGNPTINWTELPQRPSSAPNRAEPAWSPDGKSVVLVDTGTGTLIHFVGGDMCKLPGRFGGFLSADRVLVIASERGPTRPTTIAVADAHCRLQQRWPADRLLMAASVSPESSMLALLAPVLQHSDTAGVLNIVKLELLLLPVPAEKAAGLNLAGARSIRTGGLELSGMRRMVFTGDAVCGPFEVSGIPIPTLDGGTINGRKAKVKCWDMQSGKPAHETQPIWSTGDLVLSAGAGRIAVSDSGVGFPAGRTKGAAKPVPQMRGVWDVQSGKMLGLWSPDPDMHASLTIQPIARRGIAISADGKVLAESSDDSVLLYRLREGLSENQ